MLLNNDRVIFVNFSFSNPAVLLYIIFLINTYYPKVLNIFRIRIFVTFKGRSKPPDSNLVFIRTEVSVRAIGFSQKMLATIQD